MKRCMALVCWLLAGGLLASGVVAQTQDSLATAARVRTLLTQALEALRTDIDSSRVLAAMCYEESEKINSWSGQAEALRITGIGYTLQGSYSEAEKRLLEAMRWYRTKQDSMGITRAHQALGNMFYRQSDLALAQENYEAAYAGFVAGAHQAGQSQCLNNLGLVAWEQEDYPGAARYLRQSLRIEQALGNPFEEAQVCDNLGLVYQDMGRFDSARVFHAQALEVFTREQAQVAMAYCLGNLGLALKGLDDPEAALAHFDRAGALFAGLNDDHGLALLNLDKARVHRDQGRQGPALELATQAFRSAQRLQVPSLIVPAATLLAELEEREGKHLAALQHVRLATALSDSLDAAEHQAAITGLQEAVAFQRAARAEEEAAQVASQLAAQHALDESQHATQLWQLVASVLGFLGLIGWMLFLRGRKVHRARSSR